MARSRASTWPLRLNESLLRGLGAHGLLRPNTAVHTPAVTARHRENSCASVTQIPESRNVKSQPPVPCKTSEKEALSLEEAGVWCHWEEHQGPPASDPLGWCKGAGSAEARSSP